MSTLREELFKRATMCKQYGDFATQEKAKACYNSAIERAQRAAGNGHYYIELDEDEIPNECVPYFKYLCHKDCLKFEKDVKDNSAWGFEDVITYKISWGD